MDNKEQWFNNIGDILSKDPLEDIQSMDLDIDTLVSKFIQPINRYRSHTFPNIKGELLQKNLTPSINAMESRCHTFYRMLGLPVIAPDGTFYSPGFPWLSVESNYDIVDKISASNIKNAILERELSAQQRYKLFSTRSLDTSIFSLCLAVPNGQRKFSIEPGSLDDATSKPQVIPIRTQYLQAFKTNNGTEITNRFDSVSHQLAPFITDPIIEANLQPTSGSNSVLIGLPFLDKKQLEYESGKYAKRPGLEFILRLKLREQNIFGKLDSAMKTNPIQVTDNNGNNITINSEELDSLYDIRVDVNTIKELTKTFNGLVNMYYKAIQDLEDVNKQIMWIPMPGEGGPESGSVVSASFLSPNTFKDSWEIERRLANLRVKSLLSKFQVELGTNVDSSKLSYGDFAVSEFQNCSLSFDEDIQIEDSKREALETKGSNALRIIELIGGEVSGLGLIDIIAVYLALWMMDVPNLLNLIDDAAANRLNEITELKNSDTAARAKSIGNATEAYTTFSNLVKNILEWGDYIFKKLQGSPKEGGVGSIRNK